MEHNRDTFTGRMLDRASSRRNLNGVVIDTTSEHLRRKYSILRAIDDDSGRRQRGDNSMKTIETRYDTETMKIGTEGNNVSIITSLSATIDDLDAQINSLGIQENTKILHNQDTIPRCRQIYPILDDIKFDTTRKYNENGNVTTRSNDNQFEIYETPKATRRYHKPNLESTRKSMKQELSDKIPSPRIESTISTIALLDSPSIHEEKTQNFIADIPDEVERFLQNALGDELYNSTVTYTDAQHMTNSNINASELISESRTPFHRRIRKLLSRHSTTTTKDDSILSPVKVSETFDRTARLYRSLSQRVKKKLRTVLSKQKTTVENNSPLTISKFPYCPVNGARGEKIELLLRQVRVQQSIISQATKALEVCHSNKEFIGSPEEVESQRLLLIAYLRKRVLMEELKRLSSPDQQHVTIEPDSTTNEYAEVQINHVQLTLRKGLHEKPEPGEIHEWFIVVVFEGINVWATQAVSCPIDNLTIDFPGFSCCATKLTPKLKITLEVYVLQLLTGITYHHEQKYHISNVKVESHTCPSPTKFLKRVERPLSPRTRPPILLTSSFISSGYVELFLSDLILVSPWPLSAVPSDSMLLGTIDLKLSSKLHLSIIHQGFLNNGDESGGLAIWNRRWCVLKGHTLMFWNYPREQESKKPPLLSIDLIHCISERISPVNRSLCAKPRTLLIETVRPRSLTDRDSLMVECRQGYTIIRHLLSCDSTRELVDWMSKLNHVVSILREWNINTAHYNATSLPSATQMVSEL